MLCSLRYWQCDEINNLHTHARTHALTHTHTHTYIYKWSVHPSMLGCRSWSSERTQHFLETLPPSGLKSKPSKKPAEAVASSEKLDFLRSMCPYKPEHLALHRHCHENLTNIEMYTFIVCILLCDILVNLTVNTTNTSKIKQCSVVIYIGFI
jgi:hypothetical protein